jgi:hypothetical protein
MVLDCHPMLAFAEWRRRPAFWRRACGVRHQSAGARANRALVDLWRSQSEEVRSAICAAIIDLAESVNTLQTQLAERPLRIGPARKSDADAYLMRLRRT